MKSKILQDSEAYQKNAQYEVIVSLFRYHLIAHNCKECKSFTQEHLGELFSEKEKKKK